AGATHFSPALSSAPLPSEHRPAAAAATGPETERDLLTTLAGSLWMRCGADLAVPILRLGSRDQRRAMMPKLGQLGAGCWTVGLYRRFLFSTALVTAGSPRVDSSAME